MLDVFSAKVIPGERLHVRQTLVVLASRRLAAHARCLVVRGRIINCEVETAVRHKIVGIVLDTTLATMIVPVDIAVQKVLN
jgi:hypothetical protein